MKFVILCLSALVAVVASRHIGGDRVFIRDLDQSSESDPPIINLKIDHSGIEKRLSLRRRDNFNNDFPVYTTGKDGKPMKEPETRSLGSAYHDAENGAAFIISSERTEDGVYRRSVRGLLHDGDYTIYLESTTDMKRDVDGAVPHVMVRKRNEKTDFGTDILIPQADEVIKSKRAEPPIISKRANGKTAYGVELMFFCDYKCYENHNRNKRKIKKHFSYIINGMDLRYANIEDSTFSMYVRLVAVAISTSPDSWTYPIASNNYVQASRALNNFKNWRDTRTSSFPDHDHAMLMTAYDISGDNGSPSLAGLAYLSSICRGKHAVSITEETGAVASTITVAAHELGHNIGSKHDSDGNSCSTAGGYIMAPSAGGWTTDANYKNPYSFSSCTVTNFRNYINDLNSEGINCMTDSANHGSVVKEVKAPGQVFDADYQCEQAHGAGYKLLRGTLGESTFCRKLNCYKAGRPGWRFGSNHASRGTSCGNKKWCVEGDCVYDSAAPAMASDTCVYGDSLTLWYSLTCAQFVRRNKAYCSQRQIKEHCCKSCA